MPRTDTKQRILDEALLLFSTYGYSGVSVRDIARAVGIKDSSLYKHFPSKMAIYESLLCKMAQYHNLAAADFGIPTEGIEEDAPVYALGGLPLLVNAARSIFLFYMQDETAVRFRRMATIEQFKNAEAGSVFRGFFMDAAIRYQTALFAELIRLGHFVKADPAIMAYQFYSPIFLLWSQYDSQADKIDDALAILDKHIYQFEQIYTLHPEDT